MAGRIRTLKPEILEDEKTGGLDDTTFRLFVALIMLADDYGNGRANIYLISGQIWWCVKPTRDPLEAMQILVNSGLVRLYRTGRQIYYHLNGWDKHQKVNHPSTTGRVPGPGKDGDQQVTLFDDSVLGSPLENLQRTSRGPQENLSPDLRSPISDHRSPISERASTENLKRGETRCDMKALEARWLELTGNAGNTGLVQVAEKCEQQAAIEKVSPDEYAVKAITAFLAWRSTCTAGMVPAASPQKFCQHFIHIQEIVAGKAPAGKPKEPPRQENKPRESSGPVMPTEAETDAMIARHNEKRKRVEAARAAAQAAKQAEGK